MKNSNCELCITNLKGSNNVFSTDAKLVNLNLRGFLTHSNENLFSILKVLENCFVIHASSQNAFEDTFEEFFKTYNYMLKFPCADLSLKL